ncbi:unnamed protein product, partial [marine sediment metagenome]
VPANPDVLEHQDSISTNPTIRSPKDAGYQQSRARFTRYPRAWRVVYNGIITSDKNLIRTHEEERGVGGNSFTWTNPDDGADYTVRFIRPVMNQPWENTNYTRWIVSFDLEEV